jgi:PAS domain S-box-containing protein
MSKQLSDDEPIFSGSAQDQIPNLKTPELAPYWLAALIDSADDAIISKTLDGIITGWNKGAERIFGYTADEVIGKPITIIIPPDHLHEEPAILARLRAGQRIEHYETVRVRKDGKRRHISLSVSPIKTSNGQIIGASKIARDVSEQRDARRALDEASERLRLALAASNLGDWSWEAASDAVTLSETAGRILGVPPDAQISWTEMCNLLHVEDRERAKAAVETALATHTDYDIEYRVQQPNRCTVWVSAKGRGVYGEDGSVAGMLGFVQDITLRKSNEETLREQADALRTLNEVGKLISAELDLHKTVQALTDAATELTGAQFGSFFYNVLNEDGASYMLYTLAGAPLDAFEHYPMPRATDLFGPTFRGEGVVRIADVKEDPRYGKTSPYFGMPDDHLPVTSYLAVPVISRSGDVLGGLFFSHAEPDFFTERDEMVVAGMAAQAAVAMDNAQLYEAAKKARAEAERAATENERLYRQAEDSSRLKEEFLATISHELRTPLSAILGWARMLRMGQLSEENESKALDTIERNARAQAQLVDDLLDVSRIITGKLRMDVQPADPNAFIDAAVEAVRPAAEAKGVRVQKVIDTGPISIPGDPVRLQQVVWNLLSNAIKFTPRGGRVQIRSERVNSHLEIVVSDTGQGIAPDFLPHVFDRFRQADQKTSRQHGGMGLGLAIVRHLVEMHGGTVHASSDGEGQGATFTVTLPITPLYQVDPSGSRVHPGARDLLPALDACTERLDGLRILVVDDEADTRELLKQGLEYCGAEVNVVASAAEALKALTGPGLKGFALDGSAVSAPALTAAAQKDAVFDVLISDIGMPGVDGYDLIRQVRGLPVDSGGNIPAIALTAYTRTEDRLQSLRAGYDMHVPKPVELAELVAVAATVVRRKS